MRYIEFKDKVRDWPLIFSRDLMPPKANKQIIRNQLERWRLKRLLIKLRRGVFILNPGDRKSTPSGFYIANQLYSPSYVSLEYALNYYSLIPERVSDITSVTTKKTSRFTNEIGTFIYQHIKPKAFRGFEALKDEAGLLFFIAEPEKAVVDFFYLILPKFQKDYETIFKESYRFQNIETLRKKSIMDFAGLFDSVKLSRVCRSFCAFIGKEKNRK